MKKTIPILILFLIMGCNSAFHHTTYPGPKLPMDKIAILRINPPLYLISLDDSKYYYDFFEIQAPHEFELIPGLHTIKVGYYSPFIEAAPYTLPFTFEPGLEYYSQYSSYIPARSQIGNWKVWIECRNPRYIIVEPTKLLIISPDSPMGVVRLRHKDGKVINLVSTRITGCEYNKIDIKPTSSLNGDELEIAVHVLENQSETCKGYINIEIRTVDFPRNRSIKIPFNYVVRE